MSDNTTRRPLHFQDEKTPMSTSPVTYPPGSTAKTTKKFDQVKEEAADESADRATAARLDSLENFMQAQQAVQISMQQQQAEFLGQQAIFMQQVLQQMGPTTQDKQTHKQPKQHDGK